MNPSKLSEKAKELALDMGAEAVFIVALVPNAAGDGWEVASLKQWVTAVRAERSQEEVFS